ncbi:MAG: hypothetical protein WBJ37_04630 [Bacteroidales bacterium]|jgi:hypothetical protein
MNRNFDDVISKLTSTSVQKKESKKGSKKNIKIASDDSINENTDTVNTTDNNTEHEQYSVNMNIDDVIDSEQLNINTEISNSTEHLVRTAVDTSVLLMPRKKLTVEQTHRRTTVLIRNELLDRLEILAQGKGKGFKTAVFNTALQVILDDLESKLQAAAAKEE